MSRRDVVIDAQEFDRRRGVSAFLRASSLDLEEVPRRPNALVWGGAVLALLIAAGSAGTAYATGRAPSNWLADGSLVLDRETGARFVAQDGLLRPAPTLTAALLAGADGDPLLVAHDHVARATVGAALPAADLPERPPALPAEPRGLTACVASPTSLDVFHGTPAPAATAADGLLVRPQGEPDGQVFLVTDRHAFPLAGEALLRLGYSAGQVREVPAPWLALVPVGETLAPLQLPVQDPAGSVPGVGTAGDVVRAAGSGALFWIADGQVHPFENRTSELLAPAAVATVADDLLLAGPVGAAVGIAGAPSTPPAVPEPDATAVPCVRSSDAFTVVFSRTADLDTEPAVPQPLSTPQGSTLEVTWHAVPGDGALVGPDTMDDPTDGAVVGSGGIVLAVDGRAYEFADYQALTRLGYRREQTVKLPAAWLELLPRGGNLASYAG